jgi:hypothetical protein
MHQRNKIAEEIQSQEGKLINSLNLEVTVEVELLLATTRILAICQAIKTFRVSKVNSQTHLNILEVRN